MPNIDTLTLPAGTVGVAYNQTILASKVVGMAVSRSGAVADGGTDALGDQETGVGLPLTYTISADGQDDLALSGSPRVTIAGQTNCTTSLDDDAPTSIEVDDTDTFQITVTPTADGAFSFTVSIANDTTTGENPYNFTVSGAAITPAVGVLRVVDTTLSTTDGTNYTTALTFPVEANKTYEIDFYLVADAEIADILGIQYRLSGPAGATGHWGLLGPNRNNQAYFAALGSGLLNSANYTTTLAKGVWHGKAYIDVDSTPGDVVLAFRSGIGTVFVRTIEGSYGVMREIEDPDLIYVAPSDVVADTNGSYEVALTIDLEAGKTYLVDAMLDAITATSTVGLHWKIEDSAGDATMLFGGVTSDSTDQSYHGFIRRDDTVAAPTTTRNNGHPAGLLKGLVITTSATTITLEITPETTATDVTVVAGSFITAREVTAMRVTGSDISNSNEGVYTNLFSFDLDPDKHYSITQVMAWTTDNTTAGPTVLFQNIPDDGDGEDIFFVGRHTNQNSTAFSNFGIQDNAGTVFPGGDGQTGVENMYMLCGHVETDGTGGTMTCDFRRDHTAGTVTMEMGSWTILEEVEL